ncbi:hypothetical protein D3C78_1273080 [compost metagenome]
MMEAKAITPSTTRTASLSPTGAYRNRRITTLKIAILLAVARKVETGAGAPWYTSGVHRWNGTRESLKPRPTIIMPRPASSSGSCSMLSPRLLPSATKERLPDCAYSSAIPNSRKDEAAADRIVYLILASRERF